MCPMHGLRAGHSTSMAGHSTSHTGGSKHGMPARHSCTCLGACCCAPTMAAPSSAIADLPGALIALGMERVVVAEHDAPRSAPRHAHPFAIGPPAAARA